MTLVAFRGSWVLGGSWGAVLSSSWLTETGSADVGVWHGRRGAVSNLDSELLPQRPRCPAGFQSGWARLPLWSVQVGERSHGVSSCRWVITDSIASLRRYLNQPLESVVITASFFSQPLWWQCRVQLVSFIAILGFWILDDNTIFVLAFQWLLLKRRLPYMH